MGHSHATRATVMILSPHARHTRTVGNEGWARPASQGLLLVCGGARLMRYGTACHQG